MCFVKGLANSILTYVPNIIHICPNNQRVKVVEKEKDKEVIEKGLSTRVSEEGRAASLTASVEEILPRSKKHQTGDKEKEKVRASV